MGRRSDPLRVTQAQLEGARMRLLDLAKRRDIFDDDRDRYLAQTHDRVAELEAELLTLQTQQRRHPLR